MDSKLIEITDASKELSLLGRFLRDTQFKPPNATSLVGLADCFGVDPATPLYFELIAQVRARIEALQQFADTVVDPELDDAMRSEVRTATSAFAAMFRPDCLVAGWQDMRARALPEANLKTLFWFGQTARRHRPLRVIRADEVAELTSKLKEAIVEVEADTGLDWMRAPLIDGIQKLIIVIEYLRFFGQDYALEALLALNQKVSALQNTREDAAAIHGRSEQSSLWKCLATFSVCANLLLLPDQGATAISRYHVWASDLIASTPRLPHEQRLLAPPAAIEPDGPEIEKRE